jgi:hypothetical protein
MYGRISASRRPVPAALDFFVSVGWTGALHIAGGGPITTE